ncbi:MAG TPA: alkylhydroperoxidase [Colwellia sp.]|nr:alkylhydroperoxidase [Colwellia sp.]
MTTRLNYFATSPKAMDILLNQESYLDEAFKGRKLLLELVKIRVSQINQCALCIDMHSKDALKLGENFHRIYGLNAWRDMTCYSEKEQCSLQWAELIISDKPATDNEYQSAVQVLGEQTLVDLTLAINAINSWNHIAKAFKPAIGSYDAN